MQRNGYRDRIWGDARRHGGTALADQLRPKLPKMAALMDDAEQDVLAYVTFPAAHRAKLHSTNPIERLNGMAALKPKPRGNKNGEGRVLTPDQEACFKKLIVEKRPEELKMEFALWTRAAVSQLIEAEFKIKLSVRGVGKHLKRCGFTPQGPIRRTDANRRQCLE